MNTKHKQIIIFEGIAYSRMIRRVVYSATGSFGQVNICGVCYDVAEDISTNTWQVINHTTEQFKRDQNQRDHISHKTRRAVFERDNYTCLMCGSMENLHLDHIKPHSGGGSSDIENLQTLCRSCNSAKGSFPVFSARQRMTYGRSWYPAGELSLAIRLIKTLLRRGYTCKRIAEETGLPQQSVTKLAKRGYGSYESVKKIEKLSTQVMPELSVLARFVENNPEEDKLIRKADTDRGFCISEQMTLEQMRARGYSERRIRRTLKNQEINQEITNTLRQQGLSEQEIAEKLLWFNSLPSKPRR